MTRTWYDESEVMDKTLIQLIEDFSNKATHKINKE
jgi:hypothetical protein